MRARPRPAARNLDRARRLSVGADDVHRLIRFELVCGATEVVLTGDEDATCAHLDRAIELAESVADDFLTAFALSMRGTGTALLGRWRQAAADFRRAEALAIRIGVPWLQADAACGHAALEVFFGSFDESSHIAREVLASDTSLVLPALEALATEVLAVEALLRGRFREALIRFDRARQVYVEHDLLHGWGVLTKLAHGEAALCLADEQGADAVPDLLDRLARSATYARRRLTHTPVHRGCDRLLRGVLAARRGDEHGARRHFADLRALRAGARPGLTDLWMEIRLLFERRRLGDPHDELAGEIDELADTCEAAGLAGMCALISRLREIHAV